MAHTFEIRRNRAASRDTEETMPQSTAPGDLPRTARPTGDSGAITSDLIRAQFPALHRGTIFLENAGGSQVPRIVADRMRDYMLDTYVQLGAGYGTSNFCTETVNAAHEFINLFVNGTSTGKVILGPSCTQLTMLIADCYAQALKPGDGIIISEAGHEANVGPWQRLAERVPGVVLKTWNVDPQTGESSLDDLQQLLTDRTKIVAVPHISNLLGEILDIQRITQMVHDAGGRVVVDGVAYAPHRAIDVAVWNVDWYSYSTYKVYGPHMAVMYGRQDAFDELTGPNHFFIPKSAVPYKFEPGCLSHEGCAGLLALGQYINLLAGRPDDATVDRQAIEDAFDVMTRCELPLQERFIDYLRSKPKVRIIGPDHAKSSRVGTISFVHESSSSADIAHAAHAANIGIRNGHMYSYRLCQAMKLNLTDGVARVSFVHYNTLEEIERLIEAIDPVLE
jgi:cysteine desulfurase family protein (TIGR01976 family)